MAATMPAGTDPATDPATVPASTRDRLIAAAIEVFVAQGYEQARVQDIARTAGMTTGAIYANYRAKSDLLYDAIATRADVEVDALLLDRDGHDVRELLGVLGDRLLEPRAQIPLLLDAIASSRRDAELATLLRERLRAREGLIEGVVEQGKRDGSVDGLLDTTSVARFCLTLALGAMAIRSLDLDPPDSGAWHELVARLLDACAPPNQEKDPS
jgi:AcrR family transcriptional regulator